MKTKTLLVTFCMAMLLAPSSALARHRHEHRRAHPTPATNWRQIAIPPLPAFQPREPKRVVLHNGMVVFLTEDHELPLISGGAIIRGGSDSEPPAKTGLVALYGITWRTGGTTKLTGDQLDDMLEARAAKVETGGGDESTSIAFNCLKGDFPEVFGVFTDLLRHPAFRKDKLSLAQKELSSEISRRNDETASIAGVQTAILGYGRQSAYARIPEYATVANVTRNDLLAWYRAHVKPNNIILGIVGDFDSARMEAMLNKTFGDWQPGEAIAQPKVAMQPAAPGIYLVNKSDVDQSQIRMIGLGIERRNPDYYALQVMNNILGGGFASRLFVNLRTKAGLAYAVGGGVGSNWDHPGLSVFQIGTKTGTTVEALRGLRRQLEQMREAPPTQAEMKRAKDAILNSFIFRFDTPGKVLHEREMYEFYGYPTDFLERYRAGVEKVTATDVLRVAKRYLKPGEMKVLVIGNASGFRKELAQVGPITPVNIAIPSPDVNPASLYPAAAATAAANGAAAPATGSRDGKALMEKLAEDMGGEAKIASVKTLRQQLSIGNTAFHYQVEQNIAYPDRQAEKINLPQGLVLQVVTPTVAFSKLGGELREMSADQKASQMETLKRDILNVLQHIHDPKYSFRIVGTEKLKGIQATVVDINADGAPMRWWLNPEGYLLQQRISTEEKTGRQTFLTRFFGWRNFDGLHYPTQQVTLSPDGQQTSIFVKDMQLNPEIDPKLFEKPAR